MESLLRWSIENSSTDNTPPIPPEPIDPGIIEAILGKPDSQLMKEAMDVATDESHSEEERVAALDDMEMLVESIDNANDLHKLQMWQALHKLLSSPSSLIKAQTLWVIGTALQNNPSAQSSYFSLSPLSSILTCLHLQNTPKTRAKAIYALSGLLKLHAEAVDVMSSADGWATLKAALSDPEVNVRRKTSFLLNTLLLPSSIPRPSSSTLPIPNLHTPVHPNSHASTISNPSSTVTSTTTLSALRSSEIMYLIISRLVTCQEEDEQVTENFLRLLHTYTVAHSASLLDSEKEKLRKWLDGYADGSEDGGKWGLDGGEVRELREAIG